MARKPIEEKDTDPNHPFYQEDDGFGGLLDNLAPKESLFNILGSCDLIPGAGGVRAMAVFPLAAGSCEDWSRGARAMLVKQTKIVLEDKPDNLTLSEKRGIYARGD